MLFHNTTQARLYFVGDPNGGEFEDRGFPYINVGFTNYSDELMTSVMKNLEQLNPGASLSSCRFVPNKLGTFRPIGDEKEGRLTMTSARGKARANEPTVQIDIRDITLHLHFLGGFPQTLILQGVLMIWKLSLKFLNGLVLKCLVEVSYVILPFGTGWQAP